jgi:hypothetical protein
MSRPGLESSGGRGPPRSLFATERTMEPIPRRDLGTRGGGLGLPSRQPSAHMTTLNLAPLCWRGLFSGQSRRSSRQQCFRWQADAFLWRSGLPPCFCARAQNPAGGPDGVLLWNERASGRVGETVSRPPIPRARLAAPGELRMGFALHSLFELLMLAGSPPTAARQFF